MGRAVSYTDADGRVTDDPEAAVSGEIVEYDAHGRPHRRTRFDLVRPATPGSPERRGFFLTKRELPWLPVSEPAFLLCVLAMLLIAWLGAAIVIYLS
jgi:hypothetical protein